MTVDRGDLLEQLVGPGEVHDPPETAEGALEVDPSPGRLPGPGRGFDPAGVRSAGRASQAPERGRLSRDGGAAFGRVERRASRGLYETASGEREPEGQGGDVFPGEFHDREGHRCRDEFKFDAAEDGGDRVDLRPSQVEALARELHVDAGHSGPASLQRRIRSRRSAVCDPAQ